jgi:uncharacterized membrane protein YfcA
MRFVLGLLLAIAVGLSLGLIGGGGSILAVPILKYVIGVTPKEAIAMSLFIVGVVSIIGLIPHWQQGNVSGKIAVVFIPPAMGGALVGAKIASLPWITETVQLMCFGIIMLLASILMIRQGSTPKLSSLLQDREQKAKGTHELRSWLIVPLEGLGVGILTGFVGVGGGFLIIPALVLVGGVPMKQAVGTSLLIIACNSASGFYGYLDQVELDWNLIISFTVAASMGIVMGAYLHKIMGAKHLQQAFGYFVLAVAVFVLIAR